MYTNIFVTNKSLQMFGHLLNNETLFRATGIRYICDSEDPFGPKKKERTANTRQKTKLLK
jgi:hypothetical protein